MNASRTSTSTTTEGVMTVNPSDDMVVTSTATVTYEASVSECADHAFDDFMCDPPGPYDDLLQWFKGRVAAFREARFEALAEDVASRQGGVTIEFVRDDGDLIDLAWEPFLDLLRREGFYPEGMSR